MQTFYDLHVHSFWSDGDYAPARLAQLVKRQKLQGAVLADHDTILGWHGFSRAAKKLNFQTVQGIEISSTFYDTDVHILGYSKGFDMKVLSPFLKKASLTAFKRLQEMAEKLKKQNIADIDIGSLQRKKGEDAILTKYDLQKEIALLLNIPLEKAGDFINQRGAPAYVPYNKGKVPHPKRVIQLIHRAKGLAILAHPGEMLGRTNHRTNREKILWRIIHELIKYGIDGLEVYSPRHTKTQEKEFLKVAREFNLLVTGGSDFHGPIHAPQRPLASSGVSENLWQELLLSLPK